LYNTDIIYEIAGGFKDRPVEGGFDRQFPCFMRTIYMVTGGAHSTALHCTALHCTALHCTALHTFDVEPDWAAPSAADHVGGGAGVEADIAATDSLGGHHDYDCDDDYCDGDDCDDD
jgi:hypothetical protein